MCEPVTIAMAAGVGLSAMGQLQEGQAKNAAAEHNIAMGDIAAADALERADVDKQLLAHQFLKDRATGRNQVGSSGVRLDSGSTLDWENDLTETYISDKAGIDLNTSKETFGIRNQQSLDKSQGEGAVNAGRIGAAGSLLSGAARTGSLMQTPGGNN